MSYVLLQSPVMKKSRFCRHDPVLGGGTVFLKIVKIVQKHTYVDENGFSKGRDV